MDGSIPEYFQISEITDKVILQTQTAVTVGSFDYLVKICLKDLCSTVRRLIKFPQLTVDLPYCEF